MRKEMTRPRVLLPICLLAILLLGCDQIDFDRVPPMNVRLSFDTRAEWTKYGTPGALDHREFILQGNTRVPSDFPWTALTYTGYSGILLVGDINGAPYAYDLCCPVELQRDVRIYVDEESQEAVCPHCGSHYGVFSNYGMPLSGEAKKLKRGLRRYNVNPGLNGEYMVVTR